MTKQTVLVLGGTGMLGQPVVHQLAKAGFTVRLLCRDAAKAGQQLGDVAEIVPGDVTDRDSLKEALRGCQGVHISVAGPADALSAENVAALAPDLGVERIGYVSGSTVAEANRWFPMTAQKLEAERAVRDSGIAYTIFCPTWPMEQLPRFVVGGRALVVGIGVAPWHWFAAEDFGRMVARAFTLSQAANRRFYIHGPEPLTMAEALERYCRVFHTEIDELTIMPIEAARAAAAASSNQVLAGFAELMAYFKEVGEPGDPGEANKLLGAPKITLDEWMASRMPVMAG